MRRSADHASRNQNTSDVTATMVIQSRKPSTLKFQSAVWNIGSTLKKLYNSSTIAIWPSTIALTMVTKPRPCLNLKKLRPVAKLRALNIFQKWAHTNIEKSNVCS